MVVKRPDTVDDALESNPLKIMREVVADDPVYGWVKESYPVR